MSLLLVHVALHFSPDDPLGDDGGTVFVSAVWTFADWAGSGLLGAVPSEVEKRHGRNLLMKDQNTEERNVRVEQETICN